MSIHIDFETRSAVDIWTVGAWAYAAHPSTEILCLAYAIDEGPVKILTHDDFMMHKHLGFPEEDLFWAIANRSSIAAYNAFFEQCIWQNIMVPLYGQPRVPINQWRCVMAKALSRALPRSLENCGKALNVAHQKSMAGKRVMLKIAKPKADGTWHEDPDDFQKLYQYCIDDVETERDIDNALPDLIEPEQNYWFLDQLINSRGVYVDRQAVQRAIEITKTYSDDLITTVESVSLGKLDGVSRRTAVLQWCQDKGVDINGYTKADVKAILDRADVPDVVRTVLETKLQLGKTSVKKYEAMNASVGEDGRLRDLLIYHGAATGRWAGKLVQLHNLPKGNVKDTNMAIRNMMTMDLDDLKIFYPDVMGTLSSCIRGMITATPGNDLYVADYNAIEARVVMWLASEEYGLKQFREGIDPYVNLARIIYQKRDISEAERNLGKAGILGCGYGMGAAKFLATCTAWNIPITDELAKKVVETYRATYLRVRNSWYEQENSAITTVKTGKSLGCGKVTWLMEDRVLLCRLPSGRCLAYNNAGIERTKTPWDEVKDQIVYDGLSSQTNQWEKQSTYGGKLVENITQAVARDIMAHAMLQLELRHYPIAVTVHDEIVADVPKSRNGSMEEFTKIMCDLPSWAKGCPIVAKGWIGERYRK